MAETVKGAVKGDYASVTEVVREALLDREAKRAGPRHEPAALKTDIDRGLADLAAGRVRTLDCARIIEQGRTLSATD